MYLIERIADHLVVNDRQACHWKNAGALQRLQEMLADPLLTPTVQAELAQRIQTLTAEEEAWKLQRKSNAMQQLGGDASQYRLIDVPEDEIQDAMTAKYIEYDGETFTYSTDALYTVDGTRIIIRPYWLKGNYRLSSEDITDFAENDFTEEMNFSLVAYQHAINMLLSIELFLWSDIEDPPGNILPGQVRCAEIVQGRVTPDGNITILS